MLTPGQLEQYFPLFFIGMWLIVTSLLAILSGWFSLMNRYPDRREPPILKLRWQSGRMGLGVHFNRVLTLSACEGGLRVGMLRIFGIFCRDFLVPWDEISVTRKKAFLFGEQVRLTFGSTGRLTVLANVADRLSAVGPKQWPEAVPAPEPKGRVFRRYLLLWLAYTAFAASFFTLAPRLLGGEPSPVPVSVAILFPAIVFGLSFLVQYWRETRDLPKI